MANMAVGYCRAINPGIARSTTVTSGASDAQVRAVREADRSASQADSASSILVTRSHVKAQVRGHVSSLGLDRSEGLVGSCAINVPLACGGQGAWRTVVVALALGSLSVHVGVDGIRDGGVCAPCLVLVDE